MKYLLILVRTKLAVILLLLPTTLTVSQTSNPSQSSVLVEIVYRTTHLGLPVTDTLHVDSGGRYVRESSYVEEAKSGKPRQVIFKSEKQLEPQEVAELVNWAEQPDFLNAQAEYYVGRAQHGDSFTILYRNQEREKRLSVVNYTQGNEAERAKVPPSVLKLLKWADPYYFELAEQKKK